MTSTRNINTEVQGAAGTGPRRTRRLAAALAVAFAVAAAAPAASFAGYQVQGSTGSCCTADNSNNALGTTIQGTAGTTKKTLYIVGNSSGAPASTQISFNYDDTILEITDVTSGTTSTGTNGGACVDVGSPATGYKIRLGIRQTLVIGRISCSFSVRIKAGATTTGAFSSKMLTWTGGASCSSGCSTFSGTVTAANPSISLSDPGAFADTINGDNSATKTFTVTNDGNVTVNSPSTQTITGTNSNQFSIASTTCGATLTVGSTCDVVVRFSPTSAGAKTATLNVSPTYGGTTYAKTKTLTGTGLAKTYTATIQDSGGNDLTSYSSFADTVVGNQSGTYTFTVKNTGNKSATFASDGSSVALSGTNSADYTITATTCNTTVAAGSTCTVTVRFNPSTSDPDAAAGARTATVTVTPSNSADGTNTIATADTLSLSANAVAQTRLPALQDSNATGISSYSYGDVAVGVGSPVTFKLKNEGNFALAGTGSANQSISGDNASDYAITATTCDTSLAAGATCTITVTFTPSADGTRSASLSVATTDGNGSGGKTVSASLTGNGTIISYIPQAYESDTTTALSSHAFPDTVGTLNSADYTVKLKNAGTAVLTGGDNQSITGTDADQFSIVSTTCGANLNPNSFCDIVIRFNPTTAGDKSANLHIATTNGDPANVDVALSGKSIQAVQTPTTRNSANDSDISSYSFSDTVATLNSATYNVTVKNTGNVPLSGINTGQELVGTDASDFSITATTCGSSLAVNATCTVTVRFNPATQGAKTAQLKITPSDRTNVNSSVATVDLSGTGLEAKQTATIQNTAGSATEASHAFADTIETLNSATYTFTLRNTGNVQLNGIGTGGQSISGTDSGNFSITATTCGSSLAVNATCTITTRFNPQSAGAKSATLTVTPTDRANVTSGVGTSTLTGTGIAITRVPTVLDNGGTNELTSYTFASTVRTQNTSYTFTLKNTGNQPLNGTGSGNQSITGTDSGQFSITGTTCGASLAVNATCTITVRFAPTTLGSKSANLRVNTTDGTSNNPALVAITGPVIADNPALTYYDTAGTSAKTTHDFGTVNNGGNSAYTFVLKNTGNVIVNNPSTQSITGADSAKFVKTSTTCGASLAVNATCNIVVTYTPTDTTPDTATVNVTGTETSKSLTLNATGGGVLVLNNAAAGSQLTGSTSHKYWLDSLSVGARAAYGDTIRAAWDVAVEPGHDIQDVLVSSSSTTNDTAPADSTFSPITGATVYKQPGGGNRQYVIAKVGLSGLVGNGWGTGISDGLLNLCAFPTTNTNDRRVWFKLKDDQGKLSAALGSQIRVNDASWACSGSYAMISNATLVSVGGVNAAANTPAAITTPGTSVTYSFNGQRKGTALIGLRWRIRNSRTGQMFVKNGSGGWNSCSAPCTGSGNFVSGASALTYSGTTADTVYTLTTSFPARGRWIVEGVPLTGSDNSEPMQYIGSALINTDAGSTSASSPTINVTGAPGSRPATNSSYTMSATLGDGSDPSGTYNTDAGAAKTIEWDLNNDTTDGPAGDGFESRSVTGLGGSALTRNLDLTGKTPGSYTIRARVTDNGAFNVADPGRASTIYTKTITINSAPVGTDQTVDIEADASQPRAITLAGTDANGDSLTFSVPSVAGTGTLGGSGSSRTYSWPSTFTGHDTYTFVADDGYNATGNGTLTVRVRPNTTIDTGAPDAGKATRTKTASFSFSSPQSPISGYECRLIRDGDVAEGWASCSSSSTGSKGYSDLEDGSYRFEVRAVNADGQADGTPASHEWRVDNTAPVATLLATPASNQASVQPRPTNDTTPSYRLGATDKSSLSTMTYECRVLFGPQNGNWTACGGTSTSSGSEAVDLVGSGSIFGLTEELAEGTYTFEVRAIDEVGITGPVTTERFRVDTTPASSGITSGPEGLINTRDVSFGISSTEAGSTFRCRLVGTSGGTVFNGTCPGGGTTPAFTGLADDVYTITVTAIDPATNEDPNPATGSFEVDATAPTTTLVSGPPAATTSRRATTSFQGSDNRKLKGFECRLDSSSDDDWNTCQDPESYSGLTDGAHKLEIRAIDEAANRDATPVVVEWTVDLTAPSTSIGTAPAANSGTKTPSATFSSSESGSSSQCSLDGGSWTACTSPLDVATLNGGDLSDGAHRLLVRSTDAAGNVESTPAVAAWRTDTVAPSIDLKAKPANPSAKGDAEFGFTVNDGSPAAAAPEVGAECSLDGGDYAACASPYTVSDPASGSHTVRIRATDAAGNVSTVVTWSWTVNAATVAAPSIDGAQPAAGSEATTGDAQFAFSHSDEANVTLECRLDGDAWAPCESPVTLRGLDEGSHTWEVRASDANGNRSSAAASTWTVNTAPPGTELDAAPGGRSRTKIGKFRFSSNRAGATFECSVDSAEWAACTSPFETSELSDGRHTIRIRAVAGESNYDPTPVTRQWTIDTKAPETTLLGGPVGTIDAAEATIGFRSDDRLATFQCKLDSGDYSACASPTLLTKLAEGAHTLYIRAVDPSGNRDETPVQLDWSIKLPEDQGGGPVTGSTVATLTSGQLIFPGLSDAVALPAGSLVFTGDVDSNGSWTVSKDGARFPTITQAITAGGLNIVAKIAISAVGGADGTLPKNGGSASISFPAQLKVVVETDTGAVLIGPGAQCYLRPLDFRLTGTYNASTHEVSLSQNSVLFPKTSAGCGQLGGTVDAALGLPRNDISLSVNFSIDQSAKVNPARAGFSGSLLDLPLSCSKNNRKACSGALTLATIGRNGVRKTVATTRFSAPAGFSGSKSMKLPQSVLSALRVAGSNGLKVVVSMTPTSSTKPTIVRTVTLYDRSARKQGGNR